MTRYQVLAVVALLLSAPAVAEDRPPVQKTPPRVHNSACALADSMASKLSTKTKLTPQAAQQSCHALAPTMSAADHAEFMRCCVRRFTTGAAPDAPPKARQPNAAQSM
jgi:hypothetical protein